MDLQLGSSPGGSISSYLFHISDGSSRLFSCKSCRGTIKALRLFSGFSEDAWMVVGEGQ